MAKYLRVKPTTNSAGGFITSAGTYKSPNGGSLSKQELAVVRRGFRDYDVNGDGFISHRDFCEAITAHEGHLGVHTPLEVAL